MKLRRTLGFGSILLSALAAGTLLGGGCSSGPAPVFTAGGPEELRLAQEIAFTILDEELAKDGRSARETFQITKTFVDDLSMAHTRVQQYENGVPVFGREAIVHLNPDGTLFTITDTIDREVIRSPISTTPILSADEAVAAAVAITQGPTGSAPPPTVELGILDIAESKRAEPRLAYRVEIDRFLDNPEPEVPVVFIDAETGEELLRFDSINRATSSANTLYSGTVNFTTHAAAGVWYLGDTGRQLFTCTAAHNTDGSCKSIWSTNGSFTDTGKIRAAYDAHYASEKTFDYFKNVHNRNGVDDNYGPDKTTVSHTNIGAFTVLPNWGYGLNVALWKPPFAAFGDGYDGYFSPLVTIDSVAHEITHGIVDYTANLWPVSEYGAIDESWADVFGAMVERSVYGENADTWTVMEKCLTPGKGGDALRYFANPHAANFGQQLTTDDDPDHYTERYTGANDNPPKDFYGIHHNNGIANKAFYLVAKGGDHHKGGTMADVGVPNGIGADKAAAIWYRALTTYMVQTSKFWEAREATRNAAKAMFGEGSTEHLAVTHAWGLVGVGQQVPSSCSHSVCLDGDKLDLTCNSCTKKVCQTYPDCCNTQWTAACATAAQTLCGKQCTTCSSGLFNGTGAGVVNVASDLQFGPSSSFTISMFAKLTSTVGQHLLVKGDNNTQEWSFTYSNGQIGFNRQGANVLAVYNTPIGEWHHYAATYANGVVKLYEDGTLKVTGNGTIGNSASTPLVIGNYPSTATGIVGEVDQITIFGKEVGPSDIASLAMRIKKPVAVGSVVADWLFDEQAGTAVADASGKGHSMNLGTVAWSPTCGIACPYTNDINGDGTKCVAYANCKEIKDAFPMAPDGKYYIDPDGPQGSALTQFVLCNMTEDGGGWTLAFNHGTTFDKTATGVRNIDCFATSNCTSLAYSTVPIGFDLMLEVDDVPMIGNSQKMRSVIKGANAQVLGKTLHDLANTPGNWTLEQPDNSNVTHTFYSGYTCASWIDYSNSIMCNTDQLVINDLMNGCGKPSFVIGSSQTTQCAGWPEEPNQDGFNYYPDYFRVWVR